MERFVYYLEILDCLLKMKVIIRWGFGVIIFGNGDIVFYVDMWKYCVWKFGSFSGVNFYSFMFFFSEFLIRIVLIFNIRDCFC